MKVRKADIKPIVMATFPDYKGRTFRVEPTTAVVLHNLNWSGGTRYFYKALCLTSGKTGKLMPVAPWDEKREGATLELPTNVVTVVHQYFCGKDLGIVVYCHPSLVNHLLPERSNDD